MVRWPKWTNSVNSGLASKLADSGAVEFAIETAPDPEKGHFEVGNERPEQVGEGGRVVLFHEIMREPGGSVAHHECCGKEPETAGREPDSEANKRDARADKMNRPRRSACVFPQIVWPEFRIGGDRTVRTDGVAINEPSRRCEAPLAPARARLSHWATA